MNEFEPFEIERYGQQEDETKAGICPILRVDCIGERCMWWVRDWSEERRKFQFNCAVSLIAIGMNDESLRRVPEEKE